MYPELYARNCHFLPIVTVEPNLCVPSRPETQMEEAFKSLAFLDRSGVLDCESLLVVIGGRGDDILIL